VGDIHKDGLGLYKFYSEELMNLVKELLVRDPTKRLGHDGDADKILAHNAFSMLTKELDGSPNDDG